MDFIIDPEVQGLLTPLTKEEFDGLERQLLDGKHVDHGVVAVLDNKDILADGHNRNAICIKHGLEFPIRRKHFDSREGLLQWVIDNQLGRRNLSAERIAYYRGKEYMSKKKDGPGRPDNAAKVAALPEGRVAEQVASKHGVSPRTVHNDAEFAEAVDALPPPAKQSVLAGDSGLSKKEVVNGHAPILCDRCTRVGPVRHCPMCDEARKAVKASKPKPVKAAAEKVADDSKRPGVDAFGNELPKELRAAYFDPFIQRAIDTLGVVFAKLREERLADGMDKRKKHFPYIDSKEVVAGIGFAQDYLEKVLEHLKENRPAGVCPACDGKRCHRCKECGLVPRVRYKELKQSIREKEKAK